MRLRADRHDVLFRESETDHGGTTLCAYAPNDGGIVRELYGAKQGTFWHVNWELARRKPAIRFSAIAPDRRTLKLRPMANAKRLYVSIVDLFDMLGELT